VEDREGRRDRLSDALELTCKKEELRRHHHCHRRHPSTSRVGRPSCVLSMPRWPSHRPSNQSYICWQQRGKHNTETIPAHIP
jgi:hypothetical protein